MSDSRPRPSTAADPARIFWGLLLVIGDAEIVTSFVHPRAGLALYAALLAGLLLYSAAAPEGGPQQLALALTVAPLIRIVSLSLPLAYVPRVAWYPIAAAPTVAWLVTTMRRLGLSRQMVGLECPDPRVEVLLVGLGLALGPIASRLLSPVALAPPVGLRALWLSAPGLLLSTGLIDEAVFRGVLQFSAGRVLGRWAVVYVALLSTALEIGLGSTPALWLALGAYLLFGWSVQRSGSILGVGLAHGVANAIWLLIMPYVARHHPAQASAVGTALEATGLLLAGAGIGLLLVRGASGQRPRCQTAVCRPPSPDRRHSSSATHRIRRVGRIERRCSSIGVPAQERAPAAPEGGTDRRATRQA